MKFGLLYNHTIMIMIKLLKFVTVTVPNHLTEDEKLTIIPRSIAGSPNNGESTLTNAQLNVTHNATYRLP